MVQANRRFVRAAVLCLFLLSAFWAGSASRPQSGVIAAGNAAGRAAARQPPPPQPFLAGSERALPLLQEISATLKRIDDRLARIEKIMAAAAAQRSGGQAEKETQ